MLKSPGSLSDYSAVGIQCAIVLVGLLGLFGCGDPPDPGTTRDREANQRYLEMANSYYRQGQYMAAYRQCVRALEHDNGQVQPRLIMASIYLDTGIYSQATRAFYEVLDRLPETAPEFSGALQGYIEAQFGAKNYPALESILTTPEAMATLNNQNLVAVYQAQLQLAKDNVDGAREIVEAHSQPIENHRVRSKMALLRGQICTRSAPPSGCQAAFNEALASDAANIDAVVALGRLHMHNGDFDKAETVFTKALVELPETDVLSIRKIKLLEELITLLNGQGRFSEAQVYHRYLDTVLPEQGVERRNF